jgi:cytochrome c oxidase cbb3-type subunit I
MENLYNFNDFINKHFKISIAFFALGIFFGIIYSINLLGFSLNSETLNPVNMRAIHISLMLYGFVPLMLSYLPFLLINKEVGVDKEGLRYLNLYTIFWYIFLVFMVVSLLLGKNRGLAFYDFAYELNFLLAFAGIFYIIALYKFIRLYKVLPLWIKVCLRVVIIAPIALLILMNPIIGQVESTVTGPHGDNTLGMSLALIPIYYLIIKLLNEGEFTARWNILWIIPTVLYFASVLHRIIIGPLSYNQEWFFQYLTLLYVPLLYRWFKDSNIAPHAKKALLISILAFLFVDIEGNIIFIPEIRWIFHRNDLIVAHAHVAMGIAVFFMVIAMFIDSIKELQKDIYLNAYLFALLGIFTVLSISGFTQAGVIDIPTHTMWIFRSIFGCFALIFIIAFIKIRKNYSHLELYNIAGILSDGLGGIFLILLASFIYPLVGFAFSGVYEYVVFTFVCMTGVIHYIALTNPKSQIVLTKLTIIIRVFASSMFFALYASQKLGFEALAICLFDLAFVFTYLIFFYQKETLCKD